MVKVETMLLRIKHARNLIETEKAAIERRKRKIASVPARLKKGRVSDQELIDFNEQRRPGMTFEQFLTERYTEELHAFEERLDGAIGILKKHEEKAGAMGIVDIGGI